MITIAFYKGDIQYHVPEEMYKGHLINKALTRINLPYVLWPKQCFYVETDRIMDNSNCPENEKSFNDCKCWIKANENENFIILDTVQDPKTNEWHNYSSHSVTASELKRLMKRNELSLKYGAKVDHEPITLKR